MSEPKLLQKKSFEISKGLVWQAWERVRTNKGAPGVDGVTLEEFERDLRNNLYKIWNRLSSGTWFPPPVRAVEIPKAGGGVRVLGVPTVGDRIAQTVVAMVLEQAVEPIFHSDSYGYRPNRSALDAVETCRRRCWATDWVLDLDISKFFDTVDHELMLKAVGHHIDPHGSQRWVLLYVQRWLVAPLQHTDGALEARDRGTPQGSAVSPVLANLFMHYAFDAWMQRKFPDIRFERYVDDAVVHCVSQRQAQMLAEAIRQRLEDVGLVLHPDKTKIVYCQDGKRQRPPGAPTQWAPEQHGTHRSFTFLGYDFHARGARDRHGRMFCSFLPAVSKNAMKAMNRTVRSWRLHLHNTWTLEQLARWINPIVRGWLQYYGRFYRSQLYPLIKRINTYLMRWARKKYRKLHGFKKAHAWWKAVTDRAPHLFYHWRWTRGFMPTGW